MLSADSGTHHLPLMSLSVRDTSASQNRLIFFAIFVKINTCVISWRLFLYMCISRTISLFVCISSGYKWTRLADTSRHDKAPLPEKLTPCSLRSFYFHSLYTNTQIHKYTNTPIHKYKTTQQTWQGHTTWKIDAQLTQITPFQDPAFSIFTHLAKNSEDIKV